VATQAGTSPSSTRPSSSRISRPSSFCSRGTSRTSSRRRSRSQRGVETRKVGLWLVFTRASTGKHENARE